MATCWQAALLTMTLLHSPALEPPTSIRGGQLTSALSTMSAMSTSLPAPLPVRIAELAVFIVSLLTCAVVASGHFIVR